jgi:hypothetical protein
MTRSVTILGTVHQLQGAEKTSWVKIEDPGYLALLNRFLEGKDFVFEEASGLGPTTAERLAEERLGAGHYLDIDPHVDNRSEYGIGITGQQFPIDPNTQPTDSYHLEFEEEQLKRETLWLGKMRKTNFWNALLICGYLHTLSTAFKLRSEEFNVETWTYVPYLRLCPRPHSGGSSLE